MDGLLSRVNEGEAGHLVKNAFFMLRTVGNVQFSMAKVQIVLDDCGHRYSQL